ncbi:MULTISPECIES: hypothetical protein [Protofrankia]|nr:MULTISPECIES: hypothetical protein [Protofrankia]
MTVRTHASPVIDRSVSMPFDDIDYPPVTVLRAMVPLSFDEMVAAVSMLSMCTPEDLDMLAALREEVDFLIVFYGISKVRDAAENLQRTPATGRKAVWVEWVRDRVARMIAHEERTSNLPTSGRVTVPAVASTVA